MNIAWGTLLFVGKWVLIGLVYLFLFVVLIAVRREMGRRLARETPAPAVAPGRLRVVHSGNDEQLSPGRVIPLPNALLLGANPDQLDKDDLLLRDQFVSGRHARLSWDGARWWVEDLDSTNGTFVDGQQLPPHEKTALPPGAKLQVGECVFELMA